jgi:hypothetical protein
MAGVHQDFGDAAVWRRESGIFGFVKEENVFVFVIDLEKIFGQLKNVAADAGESGGVHSAVYADAHGEGVRMILCFADTKLLLLACLRAGLRTSLRCARAGRQKYFSPRRFVEHLHCAYRDF